MRKIIITVDNKVSVTTEGEFTYEEITSTMATAQLSTMQNMMTIINKELPPDKATLLKETLWDIYNQYASLALDAFIPDFMHKTRDITGESIMELQQKKLEAAINNA